jgi:hypothetical protein
MARVGRFVNEEHMLCHTGEWRSHHSLILDKPGAEDEITIRRNFPQSTSKFLFIIANIKNGDSVLSPYFFTDGGIRYEKAKFVILESKNPFSSDARILAYIERGAEGNQGRASLTGFETPRNTGSNSHQNRNTCPTYSQVASRSSPDKQTRLLNGMATLVLPIRRLRRPMASLLETMQVLLPRSKHLIPNPPKVD